MRLMKKKSRYHAIWGKKAAKASVMGAMLMAFLSSQPALANPSGGQVRAGNVNISQVGPNSLRIEQLTQKAIIDWQQFGINPGEAVRFLQPNQLSVILNRVVGQDPSKILGEMSANGNVWLINPNGVLFGPGATVNVGGLVASTLNISNEDFLSGNYRFNQDTSKPLASVINQGSITITDGGYAVLMAPLVSNEGLIVANLGKVAMLAGESATLNFDGRNLVSYDIGAMDADSGTVMVSRDTVSQLLSNVITTPELTEAGEIRDNGDGTVSLLGASGTVVNEGTISANGRAGQDAGKVVLDSGRLTVVGSGAVVEASGQGANSDGGEVLALSEGMLYTQAGSQLKARGSDQGGDGGFVETSGDQFVIQSVADVGAAAGKAGEWLIDPEFLTITEAPLGVGDLDGSIDTTGLGDQISTISTGFLESITSGTVILHAETQITVNDLNGGAPGMLNFQDGVSVEFRTDTGDLLFADRFDGVRVGGSGSITTDVGRDIYLGVMQSEGTGTINLGYGRDLIDGNGAAANIIGDYLSFDSTVAAVETTTGALQIAGWTGSNPIGIDLTSGGNLIDLVSVGGANGQAATSVNLDVTAGGAISSGNFQTGDSGQVGDGTNINIAHDGNLVVDGLRARNVDINASGTVRGGAAATDLTADSAVVSGSQIGNGGAGNALATNVATLDVEGRNDGSAVRVNTTDATLTDLTVRSNNSNVIVDGVTVANGNPATINYDDGATANTLTLIESGNRTAEIGTIAAQSVTLDFQNSISNTLGTGVISSDTISLRTRTAGADIGALAPLNQPIIVQGSGGVGTPTNVSAITNNGDVNIAHADGTASLTYNGAVGNVLDASDTGSVSLSSVSFENTGSANVNVNVLGAVGAELTEVSIRAVGSILDNNDLINGGTLNIAADTLSMVSSGGSVGTTGNEIEVRSSDITASGPGGVFIGNQIELEVFNLITDGADARITATNGGLQLTGGVLSTTSTVTDTDGDINADGYDVTMNVVATAGDLTLNGIVASDAAVAGASNGVLLNVIAEVGDILSGGTTPNINMTNGDIRLTANAGTVGTTGNPIEITAAGTTRVDAQADSQIGLNITGAPTQIDLAHNDGAVDVDFTDGTVNRGATLAIEGESLTTINYTNRTGGETIDNDGIASEGSAINITAAGDITGTPGGAVDIAANGGSVSVTTTGSFSAEARSSGAGNLDLRQVGGDATVATLAGGNLALTDSTAGTQSASNLTVNNAAGATVTVGQLTVGGDATFNNAGTINNDEAVTTDLTANNLTVVTSGLNTVFDMDTDVDSIVIDDDAVGGGSGNFTIDNNGALTSVLVDSRETGPLTITTSAGAALNYNAGLLSASDPDIETLTINEATGSVFVQTTDLSFTEQFTLTTEVGSVSQLLGGVITVADTGNLTVDAENAINILTNVGQTISLTSQVGAVFFTDTDVDGPASVILNTVAGQDVSGQWNTAGGTASLLYLNAGDDFNISNTGTNTTDVSFETGTGDIVLGAANVDGADITLIASDTSTMGVTSGRILDNGENTIIDVTAGNATFLAVGNIGSPADPIELSVPGTVTARSDMGGVYLSSADQITHLIIDVLNNDYVTTFQNANSDLVTVTYDATTTPGTGSLSVADTGGGSSVEGTSLTLIERDTNVTVDLLTDVTAEQSQTPGDGDFVRIISGGGISNSTDSTITASNIELYANNGDLGTAANAMILDALDVCVSAAGRDAEGYVYIDNEVRNLFLAVNQSDTGGGNVQVAWDNGGTRGLSIVDTVLSSTAGFTADGVVRTATDVDEAHVYAQNGLFVLDGQFDVDPAQNPGTFGQTNTMDDGAGIGGNLRVGEYTAVDQNGGIFTGPNDQDTYLELRATNGGSILDSNPAAGTDGFIDIGSGTATLVADGGVIGTAADAVEIISGGSIAGGSATVVNAYTTNGASNDINLNATGEIVYNQVYAGTDLSYLAPTHEVGNPGDPPVFTPGGIEAVTPEMDEGDVTLSGDDDICAVDIIAGSLTEGGNVTIQSTGDGNIEIGTIVAQGDTVTITKSAGTTGSLLEKENEPGVTNTEITAGTLVVNHQGQGNIGFYTNPTDKGDNAFDIVVTNASITMNDGGVYLRNIGNIVYDLVDAESTTGENVYLVSEGVTFANDIRVGDTTDMDVMIETRPGSDLMVGSVQAIGNTVTLVSTDRIRTDITGLGTTGRVQADQVYLQAERGIGVSGATAETAAPLRLVASAPGGTVTVAALSNSGGVYLDGDTLTQTNVVVGTVTDLICDMTLTGIEAATDVCIDVENGTLTVNEAIDAGDDVLLEASGSITFNEQVIAADNIGVESTGGSIVGNNVGVDLDAGDDIALRANGDIGTAANDLRVNADSLAARSANGGVDIVDTTGGLTINTSAADILKSNTAVTGVSGAGDVCVDVLNGALQVSANVTSVDNNVALRANGDVTLGNGAGGSEVVSAAAGRVSIESADEIIGNNGAATNTSVRGNEVVLDSVNGVGNAGDIGIEAAFLAADGGTGDVMLRDNSGNLTVTSLDTLKGGNTVVGVDGDDEICLDVVAGALTLTQGINANMGDPEARVVALRAQGDINLNNGVNSAVVATEKISVESTGGGIAGTTNDGVADFRTTAADSQIVLSSQNNIGDPGAGNDIEIDTDRLAATSTGGGVYLQDLTGDVTIEALTLEKGGGTVTGVSGLSDVCVQVAGDLQINADVIGTAGDAFLQAGGDVTIGDGTGAAEIVSSRTTLGLTSIESGGEIIANNGDPATNTSIRGADVVLESVAGIGNATDIGIEALSFAADGGTGDVKVIDITGSLNVTTLTTGKGGDSISGVDAAGTVCLDVLEGGLTLTSGINADMGDPVAEVVALRANGAININNAANGQIVAGDKISIQSVTAGISGGVTGGGADLITNNAGGEIVLSAVNSIGSSTDALEIDTDNLAATASGGAIFIESLNTDPLTITAIDLEKMGGTVTGLLGANDVCLETPGDLQIDANVRSNTTSVILAAGGDVTIGDGAGAAEVVSTSGGIGDTVSIEAGGEIINGNAAGTASIDSREVVLVAGTGIGNAQDLEMNAFNLAADGGSGDVRIIDRTGELRVVELTALKSGDTVTGVDGDGTICLDVLDGALTLTEGINADMGDAVADVIALRANGAINLNNAANGTLEAENKISIQTLANSITGLTDDGVADLRTTDANGEIVLSTVASLGAAGNDLEIETANLAASASAGNVYIQDLSGSLNISEIALEKMGGDVTGVTAANEICVDVVDGALFVNEDIVSSNQSIALRTGGINNDIVIGNGDGDVLSTSNPARTVSLEASGDVLDNNGVGNAAVSTGTLVVTADSISAFNGTDEFEIQADTLAASTSVGGVNVLDRTGGLNIGTGTTTKGGVTVTGVTAATDICVDVLAGVLNVNEDVTATNGFVALRTQGGNADITIGNDNTAVGADADVVTAGNGGTISLESQGDVLDNNGAGNAATVTTGTTVVVADSLTASNGTDEFEMESAVLAARATVGDVNVLDRSGALTIGSGTTIKGGTAITGVTAASDVCLDVLAGALNVNEDVTATNGFVALRTQGTDHDIIIGNDNAAVGAAADIVAASNGGLVSLEASGNVLDNNGVNNVAAFTAGTVVVNADSLTASNGADEFELEASTLAANAATGDVNVLDQNGLIIGSGTTIKGGTDVTGVTAASDVCIEAVFGPLQVNDDITATDGFVALRTQGAANDITIGNDNAAVGADADVVSTGNGGLISFETSGSVLDNNGAGNAAAVTTGTIAVGAANGISASNGTDEFELEAGAFAAATFSGDVNILDRTGDLAVGTATLVKSGFDLVGVTAGQNVCLDVLDGDLNVNEDVTATAGFVALRTQGTDNDITIGNDSAAMGAAADVVSASAGGQISLEASGDVLDNNGTGNVATFTSGTTVVNADSLTAFNGTDEFEMETGVLAAAASVGDVNVLDRTGALTIGIGTTSKGGVDVTGVTAEVNVCLDVLAGALNVNEDVTADTGFVALRTQGTDNDIVVGNGDADVVSTGDGGQISLEASGDLLDNSTADNAAVVTTGNVVFDADTISANNGTDGFEIQAAGLAGRASAGNAIIDDLTGDLAILDNLTTAKGNTTLDGITAAQLVCVDVIAGALNVNADVTSVNGDIALAAEGNITLGDTDNSGGTGTFGLLNARDTDNTDDDLVSVESRTGGVFDGQADTSAAPVNNISNLGGDVVISSATGVGGVSPDDPILDNEIEIDAARFAADGGTGDVQIRDLDSNADSLDVDTLTTIKDGLVINGIVTAVDICVSIDNSDIIVDENIVAGGDVALKTFRNIVLGDVAGVDRGVIVAGTAGDGVANISLEAGGNITDGNGDSTVDNDMDGYADGVNLVADEVVMSAGGGIGSDQTGANDDDIETDTTFLAAAAGTGDVNIVEQDLLTLDGLTITELTTMKGMTDITGVSAGEDVCIDVITGALQINESVVATDGFVALRTQGTNSNIIVGNNDATPASVSTGNGGTISLEATGDVLDNNGVGNSAATTTGTLVVNADSVTANNGADEFEIQAQTLAANASVGAINVVDLTGPLTVGAANTIKGNVAITGVTAATDVCVDVLAGALNVNEDITATAGFVALRTQGTDNDITIGNDNAAVGADADVVTSGNGSVITLESSGDVLDNNGAGNAAVVTTGTVVTVADSITASGGDEFEIEAATLAASASVGDVNVLDRTGALTIGSGTTIKGGVAVTGVTAEVNACIDVLAGALNVNEDITADTGFVALRTQGSDNDINIGNDNAAVGPDADTLSTSGGNISIEASGDVLDNNGVDNAATVTTGTVVVTGDSLTASNGTDEFEVQAGTLAASTGVGAVNVIDLTGNLNIGSATTGKGGNTVTGVTAATDACLDVLAGALNVNENITATNGFVALRTQGANNDIVLGNNDGTPAVVSTGNGGTISLEASGDVLDNNGVGNAALDTTGTVVINAQGSVSDNAGTGAFELEAATLAANAATGRVDVLDLDSDDNGLIIGTGTTIKGGVNVIGVVAAADVCIDVVNGALDINEDITAGTDIALRTQDADNDDDADITIGNDDSATGGAADVLTSTGTGTVSLESANGVVENNGIENALAVTGGNVVIDAQSLTATTGNNQIQAAGLAARVSTGDIMIDDLSGDLEIVETTTIKGGATIDGVDGAALVCIEVLNGSLDIANRIDGQNVALRADNNIDITGSDDVTATTTISVEAGDQITSPGSGVLEATNVVLTAQNGIGNDADIEIDALNFAARTEAGDLNIVDIDSNSDGLTVTELTTLKGGETVTGVTAAESVCLDVLNGDLRVVENIIGSAGAGGTTEVVALRAGNDVILSNQVIADSRVSIEAVNGGLVDNSGAAVTVDTLRSDGLGQVVIKTNDSLGTMGAPLNISTDRLAAESTTGDVFITDVDGDLQIADLQLDKNGGPVQGVTAAGDVCLEVAAGSLDISEGISGTTVAIATAGDTVLNSDEGVTADDTISVEAGGEIVDNADNGDFAAENIVLVGVQGVGNDAPITVRADNLAATSTNGAVMVTDIDGDLTVTELETLKGGDTITGVSAGEMVCLEVVEGSLTINEAVQAGTVAAVKAAGDVNSNATVSGTDKVSVESGGAVIDGNGDDNNFVGSQVVIGAEDGVGTMDDAIEIDSDEAAVRSNSADVNISETDGDLTLATIELEKNGGSVSGVEAATAACIDVLNGTLNFSNTNSVVAPEVIAIRTSDTLVLDGDLTSETVSLESTAGDILDNGDDTTDISATNLVMRAAGDVGSQTDAIDTAVDVLAAEATNGSVSIVEEDGMTLTELDLVKGGDTVGGVIAGTDVDISSDEGDIEVDYVEAGGNVTLEAETGNITDGNADDLNIKAGNDVTLIAPLGCVGLNGDMLEIEAGGNVVIVDSKPDGGMRGDFPLPPGVFAQDNVNLGEHSFYLDTLYGYVPEDELDLIIDELEAYEFLEDDDFLLDKHPNDAADDEDQQETK